MKLSEFLDQSFSLGRARLVVSSPRSGGYVLCRMTLERDTRPDDLERLMTDDAQPLARDKTHEYVVVSEDATGSNVSRLAYPVRGGTDPTGEHTVDAAQAQSPAAVIGHLTRLVVEQSKQLTASHNKALDLVMTWKAETEKTLRKRVTDGDSAVQLKMLELEEKKSSETRALIGTGLKEVTSFGKLLAGRASPVAAVAVLVEFKASLTGEQNEKLSALLGVPLFSALLCAPTPETFCDVCERISEAQFAELANLLTADQQRLIQGAIGSVMQERARAREAERKTANGKAEVAS